MAEIKVFVNWYDRKICSEEEMNKKIERKAKQAFECEEGFEEWLDDNYSLTELFNMDKEERTKALELYKEYVKENTEDEYNTCYDTYYFKVD